MATNVARRVASNVSPKFTHDCDACKFLGRLNGEDLYFCPNGGDFVRRFGNEGHEYGSFGSEAPEGTPYAFAKALTKRMKTIAGRYNPCEYVTLKKPDSIPGALYREEKPLN